MNDPQDFDDDARDATEAALRRCVAAGYRVTISSAIDHSGKPGEWRPHDRVYIVSGYKQPHGNLIGSRDRNFGKALRSWIDRVHADMLDVG